MFPVRYELNSYINLLRNSVFKGLIYSEQKLWVPETNWPLRVLFLCDEAGMKKNEPSYPAIRDREPPFNSIRHSVMQSFIHWSIRHPFNDIASSPDCNHCCICSVSKCPSFMQLLLQRGTI
jgi:hypothetical protein